MVNAKGFPQDTWKELKKEKKKCVTSQCIKLRAFIKYLLFIIPYKFPKLISKTLEIDGRYKQFG
jgi:hypothetical protein